MIYVSVLQTRDIIAALLVVGTIPLPAERYCSRPTKLLATCAKHLGDWVPRSEKSLYDLFLNIILYEKTLSSFIFVKIRNLGEWWWEEDLRTCGRWWKEVSLHLFLFGVESAVLYTFIIYVKWSY